MANFNEIYRVRNEVFYLEECLDIRVTPKRVHTARFLAGAPKANRNIYYHAKKNKS